MFTHTHTHTRYGLSHSASGLSGTFRITAIFLFLSLCARSCSAPSAAPEQVQAGMVNATAAFVRWSAPPPQHVNGALLGYKVRDSGPGADVPPLTTALRLSADPSEKQQRDEGHRTRAVKLVDHRCAAQPDGGR